MANHKSAIKRAKQNIIIRDRNRSCKSRVKNIIKDLRLNIVEKSIEQAKITLELAKSVIDKAAKKKIIHKRAASRKISRLSKAVNTLGNK